MNKPYYINESFRVIIGDITTIKGVFILQKKKRFIFWTYWQLIDFTIPSIHKNIEDAASYMMRKTEAQFYKGDVSNYYKK